MKKILIGTALSLMFLGQGVQASDYDYSYAPETEEEGFGQLYAGVGASLALGDSFSTCDDHDLNCLGYRAYLGYKQSEAIAIEGSYMNFFRGRDDASGDKYEASGLGLSVLGTGMIKDNIEGFGKVGFVAWTNRENGKSVADGTDLVLGAGAQLKYRDNIRFRGELEYIGGDMDSVLLNAGVNYSTL
ncbi:MAG: hypothetical protein CR991_08380 [Proteobacteria bacterium]|nr:MAG: hypothetical protein CR991_08380 [Pseudomonadota bacterium]